MKISKEINITTNGKYKLSGFILYETPRHYVFYKILPNGSGYKYDDSSVTDINEENINKLLITKDINIIPYILLYEKDEGSIIKPAPTALQLAPTALQSALKQTAGTKGGAILKTKINTKKYIKKYTKKNDK